MFERENCMGHTQGLLSQALGEVAKVRMQTEYVPQRTLITRFISKLGKTQNCRITTARAYQTLIQPLAGNALQFLHEFYCNHNLFDATYDILADEESKRVFDWFIQFHTSRLFIGDLVFKSYPSPIPYDEFKRLVGTVKSESDAQGLNLAIKGVSQYKLNGICQIEKGDTVFDLGGFTGDTLYIFSHATGPNGYVYTFEPVPEHYKNIVKTMKRLTLPSNFSVVPYGAWDKKSTQRISLAKGASSVLNRAEGAH